MEYVLSVVLSIAANLLTPMTKRAIRWPPEFDEPTPQPPIEDDIPGDVDENYKKRIRARNRARLAALSRVVWVHFITFFFLLAAFGLPLLMKSLDGRGIDLSATRLGALGEAWHVPNGDIFGVTLFLALMFYLPVWLLSQPVAYRVASLWDQLVKVSVARYTSLIALSFLGICFIIAGHWIYFLYPSTGYLQSLGLPFVAVFGIGYLGSQRR
ncbi:hypothetical protein [Pandoraea sputorum]|uniref:hypothetical protein n=1 Tax=Pandoraea sputorum TaxID=93222 RepID=UPI002AF6C877|nr:hypothetical protein [Pandoraea sputorum]